ncbi:V-type ATPase 116kDa subunit family protein [Pyrobaculum sp.]|uniref:V-type ATPase 116kDa subunit family protein n=1 Tax=Pyrobaculum sp. TaxID=2004705 RepID=UPI003D0D32ED
MPIERVVEFRVATSLDLVPELIYYIGKTGAAMFEERPEKLPRPRDPPLFHKIKKIDEFLNQLQIYFQPQQVSLPLEPLESQVDSVLEKLGAVQKEVAYYTRLLDELRSKLSTSREVATVKTQQQPRTEMLDAFVAIPGRALKEAVELVKAANATVAQQGNVLLVVAERGRAPQLRAALEKLGAKVLTLQEVAEIEPPDVLEERLRRVEEELKSTVQRHSDLINYAYTLRSAASSIMEVFNKSAIDEGAEVGHLFESYENEIRRTERQLADLRRIKQVLEGLSGRESLKLPEGFKLYVDPELPIEAPHVLQEINGVKVALVRGEARGLEVPLEYLADIKTGRQLVEGAIASAEAALRKLRRDLEVLEKQYGELSLYGDKRWEEHRDVATLVFYVLERDVKKIDDALSEFARRNSARLDILRRTRYKYFDSVPMERRPTLEKYPAPIRQFTHIVYMYGVPRPYEISPVPLVALMFPLFFGWMYGDLGHGFLLFLLGVLLMTKLYGGRHRDWGVIWTVTGLTSMFFGAFVYQEAFGFPLSAFGIEMPSAPLFHLFGEHQLVATEGVVMAIRAAFILGFFLILLSFLAKFVNTWLKGEPDVALGLILPQVVLFFSLAMVFFSLVKEALHLQFMSPILQLPWIYVFLVALLWSFAGALALRAKYKHHEEAPPITEELILGFVEGSLGALANIPSFARLVILILIHGVLTKLVNGVALSLGPAGIAFAIFGHSLIATAEGLFSLVQSLRLSFYETLSKFYEGRGRLFLPLKLP